MQCLCQEREDRNIKSCFLHYLMKDSASRFLHLSDLYIYVNETVKDYTIMVQYILMDILPPL